VEDPAKGKRNTKSQGRNRMSQEKKMKKPCKKEVRNRLAKGK
jgi:hypothetical protein